MLALVLLHLALADDEGGGSGLDLTPTSDINLDGPAGSEITYDGQLSQIDPSYVKGKPVTVSHSGGNVSLRCIDVDKLTARVTYTVYGTAESPMEAAGRGVGLKVGYGSVSTRIPGRSSGVNRVEAELVVSVPRGTSAVTVTQSGGGWVQVLGCSGAMKVASGRGGLYITGDPSGVTANAAGGNAKVEMDVDALLKLPTTISAPGGDAVLKVSGAQGGKLTAKGGEVTVSQVVMGTNTPTLVQGDLGVAGPSIVVSAKGKVEVVANR